MIPLIVIRPQPGCDATVAMARELGLDAQGFPLFAVRPLAWEAPPRESFDALLIGSANALRHGGEALAGWRGAPVYAVGDTSAEAARAVGFHVVAAGEGGLQALLGAVRPDHRRLLRLAGRERVQLAPPANVTIAERIVYASEALPIPAELQKLLLQPSVVLLHSAEAARHFAGECDARSIPRRAIALAALGPRIAAAAGQDWASVAAAAKPGDHALLELAREMCQTHGGTPR
jgi:uroporphyrinogen-III synthase